MFLLCQRARGYLEIHSTGWHGCALCCAPHIPHSNSFVLLLWQSVTQQCLFPPVAIRDERLKTNKHDSPQWKQKTKYDYMPLPMCALIMSPGSMLIIELNHCLVIKKIWMSMLTFSLSIQKICKDMQGRGYRPGKKTGKHRFCYWFFEVRRSGSMLLKRSDRCLTT